MEIWTGVPWISLVMSLSQKIVNNYAGKQIIARQLTKLWTHRDANYATGKLEAQSYGQYVETSRPFIHQHLLTNHPPWDIYPEHLAGIMLRTPAKL